MVRGLDIWKKYFAEYAGNYVLIGGAACNLLEEEYAQTSRATKDLDLILVVEALDADFGNQFWKFIRHGKYTSRQRGENKHEYYRFMNPEDETFPKQVEIFARKTGLLSLPEDVRIEPIHIEDDLSSLSAILMDDDYYNFTIEHSLLYEGIHIANIEALICLKAKAYNDLSDKRNEGEKIDSRDIEKHKKDVLRLAAMIPGDASYDIPVTLRDEVKLFCNKISGSLPNVDFMKSAGLGEVESQDLVDIINKSILS